MMSIRLTGLQMSIGSYLKYQIYVIHNFSIVWLMPGGQLTCTVGQLSYIFWHLLTEISCRWKMQISSVNMTPFLWASHHRSLTWIQASALTCCITVLRWWNSRSITHYKEQATSATSTVSPLANIMQMHWWKGYMHKNAMHAHKNQEVGENALLRCISTLL